jgi:peptide/nickel transport system ATP-binding protein
VTAGEYVLEVEDLRVEIGHSGVDIVDGISFRIRRGEVLGLVGESGSGKTTVGLALLGHQRRGASIAGGRVRIDGDDVLTKGPAQLRRLRGRVGSYVPQDPSVALNPALRIGTQLEETLVAHGYSARDALNPALRIGTQLEEAIAARRHDSAAGERRTRIEEMMGEVLLPKDREFLKRYPHQLSGGQQQRVALAMAFALRPKVVVLDEPTTALDVTTQAHVLDTVRDLCRSHGVAALYVSHDLAVVAAVADNVGVMYAGRLVEVGPKEQVFRAAAHPYTRRLAQAIPDIAGRYQIVGIPGRAPSPGHRPQGCFFAPRCEFADEQSEQEFPPVTNLSDSHYVRCWHADEVLATSARERLHRQVRDGQAPDGGETLLSVRGIVAHYAARQVLHDVSVEVHPRRCVALVGESGSGKTTLARCVAGLHRNFSGDVVLRGKPLEKSARSRDAQDRREIQYIFQSPYSSLNPRRTIGQIISQPLRLFFDLNRRGAESRARDALERVSLSPSYVDRYPDQLSGGERQRVAIARALASEPAVLVCDEVTSALDVSVQAAIVELLAQLQFEENLGLLFVTHNLALIRTIAQEVAVMSEGRIVEFGEVDAVLDAPRAAYTKKLLSDTPSLEPAPAAATSA